MKKEDCKTEMLFPNLEEPFKRLFQGTMYPWEALPKIKTWIAALQEGL